MELLELDNPIKKPPRLDERDGELFCGTRLQFTSSFSVSQKDGQSGIRLTYVVASGITGLTNPIIAFSNLAYTNNTGSSNNTIYNGDYASGTYDSTTGNITITSQLIHKTNYTITMSGVVYLIA